MRIKIYAEIEMMGQPTRIAEISNINRQPLTSEITLGLTLQEAKKITNEIQQVMTKMQIKEFIAKQQSCTNCNEKHTIDGYHDLIYRTLFGKLILKSPRLKKCKCEANKRISFSPLANLLIDRTAPELSYLEAKWVSLMSYGLTVNLLEEVLPINVNSSSAFNNAYKVADRLEQELGKEQWAFIDDSETTREKLPKPGLPIAVGIDGGYIHAREDQHCKAGCFEAIVGKSLQEGQEPKRFGFVSKYDTKPKRRLYEMLKGQGMQMNQEVIFLSDGAENIRELQNYLNPNAEHILDWFHITMRITVMKQIVKGLTNKELKKDCGKELDSIKWYLWHGNIFHALISIEDLSDKLYIDEDDEGSCFSANEKDTITKLSNLLGDFCTYIENNRNLIANYGIKYYCGDVISTSFAESAVNEIVSKRMVKKQQMQWTKKGAHLLLQLRIKNLNHELRDQFCKWYPGMVEQNCENQW